MLTPSQLATLKAAILADPTWSAYPNTDDGNFDLAAQKINVAAEPAFIVWRTQVPVSEIMLNGFNWVRVDNLSVGKARIWDWMTKANPSNTIDPSKVNIRAGIDETWKGTQDDLAVRAAVYAHCKESSKVGEKMFATGAGTDETPATRDIVGDISYLDVKAARNLP